MWTCTSSRSQTLQTLWLEIERNAGLENAPGCQELEQKLLAAVSATLHHLKDFHRNPLVAVCDHILSIDCLQLAKHPLYLHKCLRPGYSLKANFHHSWPLQQNTVLRCAINKTTAVHTAILRSQQTSLVQAAALAMGCVKSVATLHTTSACTLQKRFCAITAVMDIKLHGTTGAQKATTQGTHQAQGDCCLRHVPVHS